jgi:hypothetical protein
MNSYTTVTLLPETIYGTASGNYDGSSQEFYGNAVPAANYYNGQGNLQTIAYQLTSVVAVITVQATLQDTLEQAAWFDIDQYGDGNTDITDYRPVSVIGNFAYLRVRVTQFDQGIINAVTAAY